ncbi:lanthionine synthetase C family protein [Kitasatospora sp. NBC_00240]|uniref:lanthionine synthetase C family protein n=1 Tax=Kitasatospora sp. NBC_00240 TaxID=2903567 RepID=UPI0022558818|nr:lanthionine synthetase C family protein [Kitasatospora sp. NBC_00240]MCX5214686.1 lanthionine synthetase C family protein [Kitasatospora sp. NBC_00240]
MLDGSRRDTALAVATDVAERSVDRRIICRALALSARQTRYPEAIGWLPCGLAGGDAGIALLCGYLDRWLPDQGWDGVGHGFLTTGLEGVGQRAEQLNPGLYSGLAGTAFAVSALSRGGTRYRRALAALDNELAPRAWAVAARLAADRPGRPVSDFDLVSGASGLVATLLPGDGHGTPAPPAGAALSALLGALVRLAVPDGLTARWATPPELLGDPSARATYPYGNLNCGLAHGIPGPLSVLALALRAGHRVPGQVAAVRYLADWLTAHRTDDRWGVNWPSALPLPAPDGRPPAPPPTAARSSWCYGSPGTARALWHAGVALDDEKLRALAVEAATAVLRRPVPARQLYSPTFCHGIAGLLQTVLRFAHDTRLPQFTAGAEHLVDELLGHFDPARPLGYAAVEPGDNRVDRPGLLDGAAGIAMVLLAAATDTEPGWDRLFLLS